MTTILSRMSHQQPNISHRSRLINLTANRITFIIRQSVDRRPFFRRVVPTLEETRSGDIRRAFIAGIYQLPTTDRLAVT